MSADQPTTATAPRPKRRRSKRLQRRQTRLAWLMLTPALVVLGFVAFYPLGQTVYDSFTDRQFLEGHRADARGSAWTTTATSSRTRSSGTRSSSR